MHLRPLWKLWGTFATRQDLEIFNDFNGGGAFVNPDRETGAYLMVDLKTDTALLILSNFRNEKRQLSARVDWERTGFSPGTPGVSAYLLCPTMETPGTPSRWGDLSVFEAEAEASGCIGFLLGKPETLRRTLRDFAAPYPERTEGATRYVEMVETQKRLRLPPATPAPELFIKVTVPPPVNTLICAKPHYTVIHEIGTFDEQGVFSRLGYVSLKGFGKDEPAPEDIIWAGSSSPWIDVRELLPPGKHSVGIKTFSHDRGYFYSFIEVVVSPETDEDAEGAYRLVFMSEVEPERETLHFSIHI